jgi:hypothetical protein
MVMRQTAFGGATEADIRIIIATFGGLLVLATLSALSAPLPPAKRTGGELGACPPIEKIAQEGGSGWHSVPCSERWGHCHSDSCFPMGGNNLYRPRRDAKMTRTHPSPSGMVLPVRSP